MASARLGFLAVSPDSINLATNRELVLPSSVHLQGLERLEARILTQRFVVTCYSRRAAPLDGNAFAAKWNLLFIATAAFRPYFCFLGHSIQKVFHLLAIMFNSIAIDIRGDLNRWSGDDSRSCI